MNAAPAPVSGLYAGMVTHRRLKPRRHVLRYRIFQILLDLDEAEPLSARLRLFSRNRFNLLSFHDRDHGDGSGTPLRAQIEAQVARAGVALGGGPIRLLAMPRLMGYVFNPLSVYFCHAADGRLVCLVYEVSNTFGERHSYVLPAAPEADGLVRQTCGKRFYVSPFLDMDLAYAFAIRPPGQGENDDVSVAVTARDAEGPVIATAFTGARRDLTDAVILRAVLSHPLLTVKVVAGIHWEALRIWFKGIKLRPRPPAPEDPVTVQIPVTAVPVSAE